MSVAPYTHCDDCGGLMGWDTVDRVRVHDDAGNVDCVERDDYEVEWDGADE